MYNDLNFLFEDRNQKLWIGSERGISSFDPKYSGFIGVGPGANPNKSLPLLMFGLLQKMQAQNIYL